jgi:hypothetical protein
MLAWGSLSCCFRLGFIWPRGGGVGGSGLPPGPGLRCNAGGRNKLTAPLDHGSSERYERLFRPRPTLRLRCASCWRWRALSVGRGSSVRSFEIGHQQFFGRLFFIWPCVPAEKVEAAKDGAGNHDGPSQESRGIEHWNTLHPHRSWH